MVLYKNPVCFFLQVATASVTGDVSYIRTTWDPSVYLGVVSQCPDEECLVCEGFEVNFRNFSYIEGDVFIVGMLLTLVSLH